MDWIMIAIRTVLPAGALVALAFAASPTLSQSTMPPAAPAAPATAGRTSMGLAASTATKIILDFTLQTCQIVAAPTQLLSTLGA